MSMFSSWRRRFPKQQPRVSSRRRLTVEQLEPRQLLNGGITIDGTWLAQHGPAPYLLNQAGTTYTLATNVDVPGTAFVVAAPNVTLDLGGYTVTYGDSAPLTVPNGGFEQGTSPTDVPGWNLSGAPTAQRLPARTGMWGNYMLDISNFTTPQTLVSSAVAIPAAGREYAATITPKGANVQSVQLAVVDAVTGQILASGTSPDPTRGFAAFVQFTPATTDAVELRITITPNTGAAASVDLDYAALFTSRDYGIVATTTVVGNLPSQLQSLPSTYKQAANFTLQNGHVIQGQGRAYAGSPLFATGLNGLTMTGVDAYADGMDTRHLYAEYGQNITVSQSTFRSGIDNISDRMRIFAAIYLASLSGSATINGNSFLGVPQVGVFATDNPAGSNLTITNNTINQNALVTDGYAILLSGVQNFVIAGNTIEPTSGRGILLDGFNNGICQNGQIYNNYVLVQERPNLEYGANGLEVTALRLRNFVVGGGQRGVFIHDNTFIAQTGPGLVWAAIAARITQHNAQGQMTGADNLLQNNTFQALVTTTDPSYRAFALSLSNIDAGTGLVLSYNVLASNDTSLMLGDNDSFQGTEADVLLVGNTLALSSAGPGRPYTSVDIGAMGNTVQQIRLIDMHYTGGATSQWTWEGAAIKDVETGFLLNVTVQNSAGAAAVGATIQIVNASGQLVYSGITNASGQVTSIPVAVTEYQQRTSDPTQITTVPLGPFTYSATPSGGGLPATSTGNVLVGDTTATLSAAQSDASYIQKLYQVILGRTPAPAEINAWLSFLQGANGPATVAGDIERSAEARTREVKGWYQTYLGRPALNGEEQPWVNWMLSGASEEDALAGILSSTEYYNLAGGTDPQYIEMLYNQLLHRTASTLEVSLWESVLATQGRRAAARAILGSQEYRGDQVVGYYSSLLHRPSPPSAAEVAAWVNSGLDLTQIRIDFESSPEFITSS